MAAERLDLSIRKDVQGIKVTLGELSLPKDPEYELNPFEWAQVSAQAHARTLEELLHLKAEAGSGQGTIAKLNAQLEDFIKTKNEAETAMLRQFMELLNEKKRKIRDQSRLLAGAKLDEPTASAVHSARDETKPRRAGASRTSKRKAPARATPPEPAPAPAPAPEPDMESDSDQMEIDQPKQEEQVDGSDVGAATPDRNSDEETEDEDEPSQNVPPSRSTRATRATSAAAEASKDKPVASGPPPPARALPFGKPATRSRATEGPAAAAAPARVVEEEDETDDEL
ncbi:hypothetical protein BS50DRAFT_579467 [Corynespora cassiicola Philippines]|uniref:XRCC4 coiled-coil domain-containing protein n=1 Tax=Corynespora cassiicola Philippines TaxID=1448308 RepID=A0A2T2N4Z0_CORCC|nr:hypothetical protein BS50DRAFT_579467 [Corynespora cassiicola Philippines]